MPSPGFDVKTKLYNYLPGWNQLIVDRWPLQGGRYLAAFLNLTQSDGASRAVVVVLMLMIMIVVCWEKGGLGVIWWCWAG